MSKQFQSALEKLRYLIAIQDHELIENPKPHLVAMERRCCELMKTLEQIEYALSPDCVFDVWQECFDKSQIPRPIDVQGEALIRCNKALEVIRNYRNS